MKQHHLKFGAKEPVYGMKLGDLRTLAKKIKKQPELADELWESTVMEARLLAILISDPKKKSKREIEYWAKSGEYGQIADWLSAYIIKPHPSRQSWREEWLKSDHPWLRRQGWSLTAEKIRTAPEELEIHELLKHIKQNLVDAPECERWNMNIALAYIGIHVPQYREKAIEIGHNLGVYKDYPTSKGCTSPFAPIWIEEMVNRQDAKA